MAIRTISGEGCLLAQTVSDINYNFAQNLSTGGALTVPGALIAESTTDLQGAVTADSTLAVTGASTFTGAATFIARATIPIVTLGAQKLTLTAIAATGANTIDPHTAANYIITASGTNTSTLAAPTATTDDGLLIYVASGTAHAHTITATGLFQDGAGHVNLATFGAAAGAALLLMAYQAKWIVLFTQNVTMS